jgi:predicted ATPase
LRNTISPSELEHALIRILPRYRIGKSTYPSSLPAIREVKKIEFHPKVTFIIGENGIGKSTLLEAIAVAWLQSS